jgi:hypothetical protein
MFDDMACMAEPIGDTMTKKEDKKNFRHEWTEYETLDEARVFAKRSTARNMTSQDIWQRIEETVVPEIDIQIKPTDVTVTPVA